MRSSSSDRRAAVARAFGPTGVGVADVAAELGIAPSTLYRWARRDEDDDSADQLIRACQDLALDARYDELTVETVARRAGVTARTAFNCFASKRDLFHAAVDDAGARMVETMEADVAETGEPVEDLSRLLVAGVRAAHTQPSARLLFADIGVPPRDDASAAWHATMVAACAKLIGEAVTSGLVPEGPSPQVRAEMVVAAARALTALVVDGHHPDDVEPLIARLPRLL